MKVFIIGTGNVATALGKAVVKSGHQMAGVLGRDTKKTSLLATKLKCKFFTEPKKISLSADIYLVAIKDDAILEVIKTLPPLKGIVAHTSGASPAGLLKKFSRSGVLYPVQTITKKFPSSFAGVPLCIEGSDESTLKKLMQFAGSISSEIYVLNSTQRAALHIAAVFANNFSNYLLGIATEILHQQHLPATLLEPLARSTVKSVFENGAETAQTGPAVRNDLATINRHLEFLKNNKEYSAVYDLITSQIRNVHNKK